METYKKPSIKKLNLKTAFSAPTIATSIGTGTSTGPGVF